MKCFKCGTAEGALFRQNEKGVPGIFACIVCNEKPVDPVLAEVTAEIEKDNARQKGELH